MLLDIEEFGVVDALEVILALAVGGVVVIWCLVLGVHNMIEIESDKAVV